MSGWSTQGFTPQKRASLEKLTDEEKLAKRRERLIGRTVKGVLIRNRSNFAIKWNDCQFDNVYISERCVELSLGPRPERGIVAVVKCDIKTMGPQNAPWYLQHPYTDVCELVTRYRRRSRNSSGTRWLHSGMPSAINSPLFSTDPSTENSRRASFTRSERGSTVIDRENLPAGLSVFRSRRGSEVIIDGGKRWEYKPAIPGPRIMATGWSIAPVRFGGATYFVPSPPGSKWQSRRGTGKFGKGPRRKKKGRRGSTGQIRSKKQQAADKAAAKRLIEQIKREEQRSSKRSTKSAKKASKKKSPQRKSKSAPKTDKKKERKTKKPSKAEQKKMLSKKAEGVSCRKCDKTFKGIIGLMDHLVDKHGMKKATAEKAKERERARLSATKQKGVRHRQSTMRSAKL